MNNKYQAKCKVIVFDHDEASLVAIKDFCERNNLLAVKAQKDIIEVLKSYVDLGAIFLSETIGDDPDGGIDLCRAIRKVRPELPIILRKNKESKCTGDSPDYCAAYELQNIDTIRHVISDNIFSEDYPNALIRGIEEITMDSLDNFFDNYQLMASVPYLVNDRIIYGELFSLIPIESSWCKGYMMLQSDSKNIGDIVKKEKIAGIESTGFRLVNDVLSELTNMVWGGIKNRFVAYDDTGSPLSVQIPIIVNHENRYISFGTTRPQLCFKYTLKRKHEPETQVTVYQKFVFNLNWEPEKFNENPPTVNDFVNSGDLEFF